MTVPLLSLAVAACTTDAGPDTSSGSRLTPLAFGETRVRFVPGRDVEVIEVSALDRAAIKSAVLLGPGGVRVAAFTIDTQQDPAVSGAATSAALAYRPAYSFATPGGPMPIQGMPQTTSNAIGQTLSNAQIRVPDMQAYRRYWTQARIDVVEGDSGAEQHTNLPAPPPI